MTEKQSIREVDARRGETVTMHFMADEYVAGVLENSRRLQAEVVALRDEIARLRGKRETTGWAVKYEYITAEFKWLPFTTAVMADEDRARAKFREGRARAKEQPGHYRNVRLVRFTKAVKR